ncbi:chemoreceptor glutamine deamidase CheD [Clostridium gelidum]|uniref:Probable chemoreceptor glutamine deamidase CheD n=1 Tax=Clostridium gelidum TaxID=704125 RepID=A0ABM7T5V2_9CLOT|nr:chemotaxis protein CheD [Clostridium gelidum]BCZ44351.1 chemoreceptor glutamine deamidase CheD [Clostridium gelidum]
MQKIIGIGEMAISNNIEDSIKTFALASCIGVVVYSPMKKVGGMIHIALPNPLSIEEKNNRSCYYASTGIPTLINQMSKYYGCLKGELVINLYGGANSIRSDDVFNIGRKNLEVSKNILKEMNLKFNDRDTGKNVSRTIELDMFCGQVTVSYQQIKI